MRVLLSGYDSRGGVEPLVALAMKVREHGVEVRVCAPPDDEFARRLAGAGVEVVPVGQAVRPLVTGAKPPTAKGLPERAAELIAAQFAAGADGCDAVVATGLVPAVAAARSVAELRGIPYRYATFQQLTLPTPHHPPRLTHAGLALPPETDNRALWKREAENIDRLFKTALDTQRAAHGLPPVDSVLGYVLGDHPLLASDPVLDPWQETADLDVVQTGAWIVPDERPLPAELEAFLNAGEPPVYAGFGSTTPRGAEVVVEVIRAQGRRAVIGQGWADLGLTDDRGDCFVVGEVNHQALFRRCAAVVHHGGAGTTTTATRSGAPQVVVAQNGDQPYWAGRVAELGIGAAHDGPVPTFESLSAALETALAARERAAAVAATIRTDGADVAAQLVLDAMK
ncbi:glycosyl transferase [Amycolatopsis sp. NBRC 101858]|uniref:glycosyltransferase n=1 Tax=Amycolatopsis sp. NBRC 101858 TaxID=3032200 RepID=UPI00249FBFB2|nr:glycosyltransferase [Amycolatopsis sp. NBRC 101858]GLY35375.1 glycosyl transferase [Amycolatopsis sp. NBRC 101858]